MRAIFLYILFILSVASLCSCQDKDQQKTSAAKKAVVIEAKSSSGATHLYYEGRIIPLDAIAVIAPVDAEINQVLVRTGDYVKKAQTLASLSSVQLANEFRSSLSQFFQRKNSYQRDLENLQAAKALHKAGAISEEEYQNSRNNTDASYLDYFQAKQALEKIMRLAQYEDLSIENIDLTNTEKINQLLSMDFNNLKIIAPTAGKLLMPPPNENGHTNPISLVTGNHVSAGQVLWQITKPDQLGVAILVHEVDINRIKIGDSVIVTGSGFMGNELPGRVIEIAPEAQPTAANTNNLSLFKVLIRITPAETLAKRIRMGMTAKVDILTQQDRQITLPLKAIKTEDNQQWVEKINPQTKKAEKTKVITGETSLNDVSIVQGIQSGDKVLINE